MKKLYQRTFEQVLAQTCPRLNRVEEQRRALASRCSHTESEVTAMTTKPRRPIRILVAAAAVAAAHLGRDTFLPSGVAACNDFEGISPWADDSLYWAAGIGLLAWGADGRPEPQGTLSPEELEQALARFFDRPVPAVPYLLEHW